MKILLLNQYYPPDLAATGQLLADLARGLAGAGHEVHVLCSARAYGGGGARYGSEQTLDGVRVHRVGALGFGKGRVAGQLADFISFFALAAARALRLPRMDLCLALTTPPFVGLIGALLGLRGTRLAIWSMDLYPQIAAVYGALRAEGLAYKIMAALARWLDRRAALLVSLGESMTERLIQAGAPPERILTVHNWVPGEAVRPLAREASALAADWAPAGCVTLMYSGNLGLGHDLETLARAAARAGLGDALRLLLVGGGKMRAPLERLTRELGLGNVLFAPLQPLEMLSESLAAGDIHAVTQRPGTQGYIVPSKVYGVLAAARPVLFIGPEDCEPARIVRASGAGVIVAPGDIPAAAAAIARLAGDGALRQEMGRRARQYYLDHFGRERSVARIVTALESAAAIPSEHTTRRGRIQS